MIIECVCLHLSVSVSVTVSVSESVFVSVCISGQSPYFGCDIFSGFSGT